ncbi:MAG: virulence RhuM family protein [Flavobacterium sp.]|nr:virulence RhuM family protein [Flavobacterium sp.]
MEHQIEIFSSSAGIEVNIDVKNDSLWATQKQIAKIFNKDSDTIGLHLKNIFSEQELDENATTENLSVVQIEGNRKVKRYNLDAIISVGYRVNSKQGTQFRQWAIVQKNDF